MTEDTQGGTWPPIFTSPEDAKQKGVEFFEYCEETKRYPTVTAFAVFMACSRQALWHYAQLPKYKQIMLAIKDKIYDEKYQSCMAGDGVPSLVIWDGVNNHGMINSRAHDKSDVSQKTEISMESLLSSNDQGGIPAPPGSSNNQQLPAAQNKIDADSAPEDIDAEIRRLQATQAQILQETEVFGAKQPKSTDLSNPTEDTA